MISIEEKELFFSDKKLEKFYKELAILILKKYKLSDSDICAVGMCLIQSIIERYVHKDERILAITELFNKLKKNLKDKK